ncbi:hypothetical protein [Peribacillus muralis]|uniref:hypothetical protein n=1 Tax=Peribacillus muralis TaxID=264697 RepID=UPI003670AD3C
MKFYKHILVFFLSVLLCSSFQAEWIVTEGARLLREMRYRGYPAVASAEKAPQPPAERERPQWKGTV